MTNQEMYDLMCEKAEKYDQIKVFDLIFKFKELIFKYSKDNFSIYFMFHGYGMVLKALWSPSLNQSPFIYNHEYTYDFLSNVLSKPDDFDMLVNHFMDEASKEFKLEMKRRSYEIL